jgi:vacuolar-type H+-ATPase subunit H
MEDLLNKIKETEKEAQMLVSNAENEANVMIDKTRDDCARKLEESKKEIHSRYSKKRENEIKDAKEKKDKMIVEKVNEFKNKFGDIDLKKKDAFDYLKKIITG